jgi:hypothetical protein
MRIKWCMFLPRWDRQLKFMYAQNQGVERGWKNFTLFDWYDMMQRYFHYLRKREVCSILCVFHYPKQASDVFLQSEWEGTCLIDVCSKCQHRGAISKIVWNSFLQSSNVCMFTLFENMFARWAELSWAGLAGCKV